MFSIERSAALFVAVPAGVLDDNRYEAQVSAMAHSGIYSNLGGDPANHERNQATVTERHSQGRILAYLRKQTSRSYRKSPRQPLRQPQAQAQSPGCLAGTMG